MIGALGDVVEDVLVHLDGPINHASDTDARVTRRRGGSAATVAVVAAQLGGGARLLGQVGDDPLGHRLLEELKTKGVEFHGRIEGRTGSIVVLVHPDGERTMLSDRGSSNDLDLPKPAWLDNLHTLHVPFYSLVREPLASTANTLVGWARERNITVSVDASSSSVLRQFGLERATSLLRVLRPKVIFFNEDEAKTLEVTGDPSQFGAELLVVKKGQDPATLYRLAAEPLRVPVPPCDGISNTTGAGDAFASGFLTALASSHGPETAMLAGHASAASLLTGRPYADPTSGS